MTHCLRYESAVVSGFAMGARGRHKAALTLDGRVIFIYKVTLDQLDGQARLSDTTAADYDELVLSEELGELATRVAQSEGDEPLMPLRM